MINSLYFFYGDESFLIEEEVNRLIKQNTSFSKESLTDKFKTESLYNIVATPSLFSQPKLILLKNPWFISGAITDKDYQSITDIFHNLKTGNEHKIIIFLLGKSVDQRKKIVKLLKKEALVKEFVSFKAWEQDKVFTWIKNRVQILGKNIDQDAVFALEQIGGVNLRQLSLEIEKIIVYLGKRNQIVLKDVTELASAGATVSIFHFNEAMKEKNITLIMKIASLLLKNGEDPIKLLGLVSSNIRLYYQVINLLSLKKSFAEIAKILGKNPYYLQKITASIKNNYSISTLKKAFAILNNKDIEIKSGKINAKTAFNLSLVHIFA